MGCCGGWAGTNIMTVTWLLDNVALFDIRCSYLHFFLRHVIIVLLLRALISCILGLMACRLLWYWRGILRRVPRYVLFPVLITAYSAILLKLYTRNGCRVLGTSIWRMGWEVLWSCLVAYIVYLRNLFPATVGVVHVGCHIPIAFIILSLLIVWSLVLYYLYPFRLFLGVLWDSDFLLLHYDVALLVWFLARTFSPIFDLFLTIIVRQVSCDKSIREFISRNCHC